MLCYLLQLLNIIQSLPGPTVVEAETGQELLKCQSIPLEWMNWNQLISNFASSPHCIARMSLWLAEPRLCAWSLALLWWEKKKLGEGVSRDIDVFLAGRQCSWSVPPRLCPMVKRELPRKKNQSTVKKAKCWVLREGKLSASKTPKYTQRGEMDCPSSQDYKSFTSGLEDRTSEAGCTFY